MAFRRAARAHTSPVTAFDISPDGTYLGTGSSEGDALLQCSLHKGVSRLMPMQANGRGTPRG